MSSYVLNHRNRLVFLSFSELILALLLVGLPLQLGDCMLLVLWLVFFQIKLQVKVLIADVASCPVMLEWIVLSQVLYFLYSHLKCEIL